MSKGRVAVVVLGEVGRSPRACYHATSLARASVENGLDGVILIGYPGGGDTFSHPSLTFFPLTVYPLALSRKLPLLFNYLVKIIWQIINLFLVLFSSGKINTLICQNPPAIPTLCVCWIYCLISRTKFIIDWHNYGYSLMALTHGKDSPIVKIAANLEFYFGRKADANFCVSRAMKNDLLQNHNILCKLLYDCPPDIFKPVTNKEKHNFFMKLSKKYPIFSDNRKNLLNDNIERTIISEKNSNGDINLHSKRPGILFSSTSWTIDEDFTILLNALEIYDKASLVDQTIPPLICVITGKGPMKDFYLKLIECKKLEKVKIFTPWLETNDYPLMVASSDLGVCLHTSSSGLDLPMKIVDMFGCCLPVFAYKYECLKEIVIENENGYMFGDSDELAEQIKLWFKGFPNNLKQNEKINRFKNNLIMYQKLRWNANWDKRAKQFFF